MANFLENDIQYIIFLWQFFCSKQQKIIKYCPHHACRYNFSSPWACIPTYVKKKINLFCVLKVSFYGLVRQCVCLFVCLCSHYTCVSKFRTIKKDKPTVINLKAFKKKKKKKYLLSHFQVQTIRLTAVVYYFYFRFLLI